MNNDYKILFGTIAEKMETISEMTMEIDKEKNDLQGYKTAKEMRSKYARLKDLFSSKTVDYKPTKNDIIDIYIGTTIIIQQFENDIKKREAVLHAYKNDLVPKLQQASQLEDVEKIEEIFTVK